MFKDARKLTVFIFCVQLFMTGSFFQRFVYERSWGNFGWFVMAVFVTIAWAFVIRSEIKEYKEKTK